MIVTIDGPAAAGKGTLAKKIAEKYELSHLDTGMLYRAVAVQVLVGNIDPNNEVEVEKIAKNLTLKKVVESSNHPEFRGPIGGNYASITSALPKVRAALLKMQQDFSKTPIFADGTIAKGAVYDGRDTGTVICPSADYKFFLTATTEVRAGRRFKEFQEAGKNISYESVLADMIERDTRDSSRSSAPLKPAEDAVIIDTSNMTLKEVFDKVCSFIKN